MEESFEDYFTDEEIKRMRQQEQRLDKLCRKWVMILPRYKQNRTNHENF